MAYEQEKKFLADGDAKRVSYYCSPRTGGKRLVRRWTTTRKELMSSSLTYINTIMAVTNPQADGKEYPGEWRVISNTGPEKKTDPNVQGITQTLAQGILDDYEWGSSESTLDDGYSYSYRDSAYLIQAKTPGQGEISQSSNTLNDKLLYDADANITRSHPYNWNTHTTENAMGYADDIGYKNYLTRPEAPASTVQGTIYDARSSLNRDGTYDGSVGYGYSKPRLWEDVSKTVLAESYDRTYVNYRTRPTAPDTLVLGLIYDSKSTVNKDDTYNGNVSYQYAKPAEWYDVVNTVMDEQTGYSYLNKRAQVVAPSGTALGFTYDAKSSLNKDGTYNGDIGVGYSKPIAWTDATQTVTGISSDNSYRNYRTKPTAPEAETIGFVYDARMTLNRDGTYNGGIGYEYAKPAEWSDKTNTTLGTTLGYSYANQRTKPAAHDTLAVGFVYDGKSTLNRDGTYNGGVGYEYAKPVMLENVIESTLMTIYGLDYLAYRTRPTAPAAAVQGMWYDSKSTISRDGTYNGGVGYEYAKPVSLDSITGNSVLGTDYEVAYLSYRTRPEVPADTVQGLIYDAKSTIHRDGTYHGGVGYSYSKPVMLSDHVGQTLNTASYEVAYLNYRTRPAIPSVIPIGTVYDTKSTIGKDGSYQGQVGYQKSAETNFYLYWRSNEGAHGVYEWQNNRNPQTALDVLPAYMRNTVSVGYQTDGTFRLHAGLRPTRSIAGSGAKVKEDGTFSFYRRQYRAGFTEYRTLTIKMTVAYFTSREAAFTFIDGGADGSKVEIDDSNYMATLYEIAFGTWDDILTEPDIEQ